MKWLKLFEGFESNDYYQEISGDDYILNNSITVHMSDKTKSKIDSWFSNDHNNTTYFKDSPGRSRCCTPRHGPGITISFKEGFLYIYELEDEWFDVTHVSVVGSGITHYKCDQLEGLRKFLTDKGFIQ
jgi:hypothetical protein